MVPTERYHPATVLHLGNAPMLNPSTYLGTDHSGVIPSSSKGRVGRSIYVALHLSTASFIFSFASRNATFCTFLFFFLSRFSWLNSTLSLIQQSLAM
jgi:hypothetical protein